MAKTLFHYTSRMHLPRILEDGFLKTVESNISIEREHAGPDVVWLTTEDNPFGAGHGLEGSLADKREVRFTVEVGTRTTFRWRKWSRAQGMDPQWRAVFERVGGAETWWVSTRPIPSERWVDVRDTRTGEVLWAPPLAGWVDEMADFPMKGDS